MARGQQVVRLAAACVFVLAFALEASARTETLRWRHADPSTVSGFRVHWRVAGGGTPARVEDAGLPARDSQGVYSYSVVVDDGANVYLSLTAYNPQNISSFPSNEICRGASGACTTTPPPTTPPPTEPPPPTGGTPKAQVTGFRLWDARNDTIIDNNFTTGEAIALTEYDCVAIEIVGNTYLNGGNGGSVKKELDTNGGSCTTAGVTHDNNPPFAYEADEGPNKFACSAALRAAGPHTLRVTPYDGPNCSGNAGSAQVLQFQTLSLGAPGRPVLVSP
jgi:hypothetical protein